MYFVFGQCWIVNINFFEMKKQHDEEEMKTQLMMEKKESNENVSCDTSTPILYDIETCKSYLRQPKATQILAIMILFGLTQKQGSMKNMKPNLIEVKTGEGKSLVLAVAACVIGLLEFNAYCVCYGELLMSRDYQEFSELFIRLGVSKKVNYGLYGTACTKLIDQVFDLRFNVLDMICNSSNYVHPRALPRQKHVTWDVKNTVLLVDEVDAFFDKRYFGRTRARTVKVKHECVSRILDQVWKLYKNHGFHTKDNDNKENTYTKVRYAC